MSARAGRVGLSAAVVAIIVYLSRLLREVEERR